MKLYLVLLNYINPDQKSNSNLMDEVGLEPQGLIFKGNWGKKTVFRKTEK